MNGCISCERKGSDLEKDNIELIACSCNMKDKKQGVKVCKACAGNFVKRKFGKVYVCYTCAASSFPEECSSCKAPVVCNGKYACGILLCAHCEDSSVLLRCKCGKTRMCVACKTETCVKCDAFFCDICTDDQKHGFTCQDGCGKMYCTSCSSLLFETYCETDVVACEFCKRGGSM